MDEIKEITEKINKRKEHEEQFWLQRSHVRWLQAGDANTAFFHQSAVQRRRLNHIGRLQNASGNWTDDLSSIWRMIDDHFLRLFSTEGSRCWGDILECVDPIVTAEMNVALGKPVDE
ncbi:hypothetical protein ACFXTO_023155 [Malus domestica]